MNLELITMYAGAGLAAGIPIVIWLFILFKREKGERKYLFGSFIGGVIAVLCLLGLQLFWDKYPQFDIFKIFTANIKDPKVFFSVTYIIVGILEEIIKQLFLRYLDTRKAVVKSVNDSIRYSLTSALGFAFAENIFYFRDTFLNYGGFTMILLTTFVFRSVFTAAGHMCFSGIFGYYYGLGRFSSNIAAEAKLEGKKFYVTRFISRFFGMAQSNILRRKYIVQGFLLSIILHGIFNFILTLDKIFEKIPKNIPTTASIVLVGLMFSYLYYLRQRQSVNLEQINDISESGKTEIQNRDTQVILELATQWLNEKRYKDVMGVADRYLKKDPTNKMMQLIKAKAEDGLSGSGNVYNQAVLTFMPDAKQKIELKDQSRLEKYNEIQKKQTETPKVQLKKEDDDTYHL